MTYSIVARDPETGRFGIAVQSHFLGVGLAVLEEAAGAGPVPEAVEDDLALFRGELVEALLRKEWGGEESGWGLQAGLTSTPFSLEHTGPADGRYEHVETVGREGTLAAPELGISFSLAALLAFALR